MEPRQPLVCCGLPTARKLGLCLMTIVLLLLPTMTSAQSGTGDYTLLWTTLDGGGGLGRAAGQTYIVHGAFGQPDAGPALAGGEYALSGGFWVGSAMGRQHIYLPLVLKT